MKMPMRRFSAIILAFLFLAGCQSLADEKPTYFSPAVQDEPSSGLLRLSYTNDMGRKICLDPYSWPSRGGFVNTDGEQVYLLVRGVRYYHRREQDNCPKGCNIVVPAGKRMDGFLRYNSFELPQELYHEPKVLHFEPIAGRC